MLKDKRKAQRRLMRYSAWVMLNDEPHGCVLADISETGAKIDVEDPNLVPDRFVLMLSGNGSARRLCHVVWRAAHSLGVSFEGRTPAKPTSKRRRTYVPTETAAPLVPADSEPAADEAVAAADEEKA